MPTKMYEPKPLAIVVTIASFLYRNKFFDVLHMFLCMFDVWSIVWIAKKDRTEELYKYVILTGLLKTIEDSDMYFFDEYKCEREFMGSRIWLIERNYACLFKQYIIKRFSSNRCACFLIHSSRLLTKAEMLEVIFVRTTIIRSSNKEDFAARSFKCQLNEDETMSSRATFATEGHKYQDDKFVFTVQCEEDLVFQSHSTQRRTDLNNPVITLVIAELSDTNDNAQCEVNLITIFNEAMPPLKVLENIQAIDGERHYISSYVSDSSNIVTNAITRVEFSDSIDYVQKKCTWRFQRKYPVYYRPKEISVSMISMFGKSVGRSVFQNRMESLSNNFCNAKSSTIYDSNPLKCFTVQNFPYTVFPKFIAVHPQLEQDYNNVLYFYMQQQEQQK